MRSPKRPPRAAPDADAVAAAFGAAAGGVFFECDAAGRELGSGGRELAAFLQTGSDGGAALECLAAGDPEAWAAAFAKAGEGGVGEEILSGAGRDGERRLFRLRVAPAGGRSGRRLGFLRDDTEAALLRERLGRAQSLDAEMSARLQAAVLVGDAPAETEGLSYAAAAYPSKLVDGDFLGLVRLAPGQLDFILGDVMGKGMEAAILGAAIKFGVLRAMAGAAAAGPPPVAAICAAAEAAAAGHLRARRSIATLVVGRWRAGEGLLEFVDCGHTGIVHYRRRDGSCRVLKGADMPFGFAAAQSFRTFLAPYDPGDLFLAYSDGLSECPGGDGSQFGEERILRVLAAYADREPAEIAALLAKLCFDFSAAGFSDDVSLICARAEAWAQAPPERRGRLDLRVRPGAAAATAALRAAVGADLDATPGLEADEGHRLVLAAHEALANVAEHGLASGAGRCRADWRIRAGYFSLELSYRGPDYAWLNPPAAPLAGYAARGYGQAIIGAATDSALLARGLRDEKTLVLCRRLRCRTN